MLMAECPKFLHCKAPICPLEADYQKRTHLKGEPVCFYLAEAVKDGARATLEGYGLGKMFEEIHPTIPDLLAGYAPLRFSLRRAMQDGSRMQTGSRLQRARLAPLGEMIGVENGE
jgi:hypothetical protein